MSLPRLNPDQPDEAEAIGWIAPYVRVATHVGYDIAWVSATTDEQWASTEQTEESVASKTRVELDLAEALMHLETNHQNQPSAFVNQQQCDLMSQLRQQVAGLTHALPESRSDALAELKTLADNLAYAGATFERHATGNLEASEGRNA